MSTPIVRHDPVLRIVKRTDGIVRWRSWAIRGIAVVVALLLSGLFIFSVTGLNPIKVYAAMFDVIDPKLRASSVGILTAFALIVGCLAPVYLGAVQGDGTSIENFSLGIASMGIFFLVGGLLIAAAAKYTFLKERYEE